MRLGEAVSASSLRSTSLMLLSPDRGRGWERGLHELSKPPLLASPPIGGEEFEGAERRKRRRSALLGAVARRDLLLGGVLGRPVLDQRRDDRVVARVPLGDD